jgi:hypothetical protein
MDVQRRHRDERKAGRMEEPGILQSWWEEKSGRSGDSSRIEVGAGMMENFKETWCMNCLRLQLKRIEIGHPCGY